MNGLGLLKSGSLVKAVVVVDEAYEGWAITDQILRMATGTARQGSSTSLPWLRPASRSAWARAASASG